MEKEYIPLNVVFTISQAEYNETFKEHVDFTKFIAIKGDYSGFASPKDIIVSSKKIKGLGRIYEALMLSSNEVKEARTNPISTLDQIIGTDSPTERTYIQSIKSRYNGKVKNEAKVYFGFKKGVRALPAFKTMLKNSKNENKGKFVFIDDIVALEKEINNLELLNAKKLYDKKNKAKRRLRLKEKMGIDKNSQIDKHIKNDKIL